MIGVFLGSLAWQSVLAVSGSVLGRFITARWRLGVSLVGYAVVAGYALALAAGS